MTDLHLCDNCKNRNTMCCICTNNNWYCKGNVSHDEMVRNRAIEDFVEHITLPLTTEEDIEKILIQLKENGKL